MDEQNIALETVAQELMDALDAKDVSAVAEALSNAFQLVELQPHLEGPHEDIEEEEEE